MDESVEPLDERVNEPVPVGFDVLQRISTGSVSGRIPIVLLEERSDGPYFTRAYRHMNFMSIYVAHQGTGTHFVEDIPSAVQAGDVYAMGIGMSHRFEASEDLQLSVIHFAPSMFPSQMLDALSTSEGLVPLFQPHPGAGDRWLRLDPAAHAQVRQMFDDMKLEWEKDSVDRALVVQAIFLRFLVFLGRRYHSKRPTTSRLVSGVCEQIESRYAEPLRIQDLAASVFLSTRRFTEVFRAELGCSPRKYLGSVRIRAAQELLRTTTVSISTIAIKTGFPDPAYFTRFFKQEVGISPSQFRDQH